MEQPGDPQVVIDAINAAAQRLAAKGYVFEARVERGPEDGLRSHLGASVVGHSCARHIWYAFRWTGVEEAEGRMIRLWSRGDIEEFRFEFYLREAGAELWTTDPVTGGQWRISDVDGHFGGSSDGVIRRVPGCDPSIPMLLEFKTSNDKGFKKLLKDKVAGAKFQHFVQMQSYMRKLDLPWALYLCVNKDNDQLYAEFIKSNAEQGDHFRDRARGIIYSNEPPPRVSNSPSWFECKWCQFYDNCHKTKVPLVNCRTCAHSTPGPDKSWTCARGNAAITDNPKQGCAEHVFNPHMLNMVQMVGGCSEENYVELELRDGTVIKHGPDHVTSQQLLNNGQL